MARGAEQSKAVDCLQFTILAGTPMMQCPPDSRFFLTKKVYPMQGFLRRVLARLWTNGKPLFDDSASIIGRLSR